MADVRVDEGFIYNEKWQVVENIGGGEFGRTYLVKNLLTDEIAAMKVTRNSDALAEISALDRLKARGALSAYFPKMFDAFDVGCVFHHKGIVMSLTEENLDSLLYKNGRKKFVLKTTLRLSWHLVSALQFMHSKKVIHRDLHASNILMKKGANFETRPIIISDFGSSISVAVPRNRNSNDKIFGTSEYCSPRMHKGMVATSRDDLTMMILKFRTENPFIAEGGKTSIEKRIHFETCPENYIESEEWILEMAKCVFGKAHEDKPDYTRLFDIVENAEYGFTPKFRKFHLSTTDGGEKCLV